MRINFSTERYVASFYPLGLFELNVHKSLERALAFCKWSESTQIYSIVWSHSQTCLERIVFKESLVSFPRLINNTLIFLVLMLTALAIKLRWYAELLSSSSQNLKTYPTISAKCSIQIKINLSSRFNMIWCSPEARGRNKARTTTQEQSSRLNCAMFRLCVTVCGHARCLCFLTIQVKGQGPSSLKHVYSAFNLTTL